jgi:hypothetical protein
MTTEKRRHIPPVFTSLLAGLLLSAGLHCQGVTPSSTQTPKIEGHPKKSKKKKTIKLRWPHLKFARKSLVKEKISDLVSKKDSKRKMVEKLITRYGVGITPVLLGAMHDRQKPKIVERLSFFLDQLLKKEHAALLAKEYRPKNKTLSLYLVRKLASFEDKALIPFLKRAQKNSDPQIIQTATLALASLGETSTLPYLAKMARDNWQNENRQIRKAALGLHGDKASDLLVPMLAKADDDLRIGILRVLAVAGTKKVSSAVSRYLDSTKHQIRVAAVNALRGIVDGDAPYANLSVFSAIEEVKKWKRRVH